MSNMLPLVSKACQPIHAKEAKAQTRVERKRRSGQEEERQGAERAEAASRRQQQQLEIKEEKLGKKHKKSFTKK